MSLSTASRVLGVQLDRWSDLSGTVLPAVVVFLVALPLSLGVAMASGVPPALGLVSAIVGGLVVGRLAGSPLQVSGPAAGLAVIVWDIVQNHGLSSLGIIVLLAGAMQLAAGWLQLGRWFRAVSPAVIRGMLAGIGLLILASQAHVVLGGAPTGSGLGDWLALPAAVFTTFLGGGSPLASAFVGLTTIGLILGWERLRPERWSHVPGALIGVVGAAAMALVAGLPVTFVELPASLASSLNIPSASGLVADISSAAIWTSAAALAAVASAEAMLSATAVDSLHEGDRTDYDRELVAQGVGNIVAGVFGALPVTGVIVRSSANVEAGAKNRIPAMLHGALLLTLVLAAPFVLQNLPIAALAAILVVTGWRLIAPWDVAKLWSLDRTEAAILMATALAIVGTDLLTGVLVGLALAGVRLLVRTARLDLDIDTDDDAQRVTMTLHGDATFVGVPDLAEALDAVPDGYVVELRHDHVRFIDHAFIELVRTWETSRASRGNRIETTWPELLARYVDGDAPIAREMRAAA